MLICSVFCSTLSLLEKRNTGIFSFLLRLVYIIVISLNLVESFRNLFTSPFAEHCCVQWTIPVHVVRFPTSHGFRIFKSLLVVRVNNLGTGAFYVTEHLLLASLPEFLMKCLAVLFRASLFV